MPLGSKFSGKPPIGAAAHFSACLVAVPGSLEELGGHGGVEISGHRLAFGRGAAAGESQDAIVPSRVCGSPARVQSGLVRLMLVRGLVIFFCRVAEPFFSYPRQPR